jgi:PhnB protein
MKVCPYLLFNGQCEEAFNFYAKLLGGKIEMMLKHGDSPAAERVPTNWGDKIMHAYLTRGDLALMGSDAPPGYYSTPQGFSVQLAVDSPADAKRIYDALAEGGTVKMPLGKTFWADQFAMLVDRFSIPWIINYAPAA